jgi:hypothetical protein
MGRVIFYLYTGNLMASTVPEIYQEVCTDPGELTPTGPKIEDDDWVGQLDKNIGTTVSRDAKVSVMVYACADMMMINDLRSCAAKYFLKFTNEHFWHYYFHDALGTMLKIVTDTDTGLRIPVLEFLLQKHISAPLRSKIHEKTLTILRESSGGWWDMATQELARSEQNHKSKVDAIEKKWNKKISLSDTANAQKMEQQARGFADYLNNGANFRCKHNRNFTCTAEFVAATSKWCLKLQPTCQKNCQEQIF